jgi:glyoxylase I family protein
VHVGGVHHLAIKAKDVERTAAFYTDVLGLRLVDRHLDDKGAVRSIWLQASADHPIAMIERSAVGAADPARTFASDPPGLHLLAFTIEKSERTSWKARLEHAGHAVVHETRFTIYVLDPEGNRVGLSSHPDPSG